ncbi:MAG TPA: NBR1-Ig-like domain-containing protein [Anaerolineales bacterium]|nr:NBR1-Ig-like domain-containing protein [Anaerolineales bacterium]
MYTKKHLKLFLYFLLAIAFGLTACKTFLPSQSEPDVNALYTAAAQTVIAQATQSAGETAIAQVTQIGVASATVTNTPTDISLEATNTSLPPTATWLPPTATWWPTATWIPPTATRVPPTATPIPPPCDWARFVTDITVPDGTTFLPGSTFVKTWRIRNIGSCAWNSSYSLVYVSGDRFHTTRAVPLPGIVHPGNMVDLSIQMVAPNTAGSYRSYWMISNPYGQVFGIGANANKPFWVDIKVSPTSTKYSFDFALSMCTASWRSSAGLLPCPGNQNSSSGSAIMLDDPVVETGKQENEPTLWTRPETVRDGWIMGVYPVYEIKPNDHFMAEIGCLDGSVGCDVIFYLNYQIPGKPVKNLGSWRERYEGQHTRIDIDLTPLAGKSVQFILNVTNNGQPAKANAFWLAPSIRNNPTPLIPTPEWQPPAAVQAALLKVSQETGIPATEFVVTGTVQVDWRDSCLELPAPGMVCAQVIIPGYKITMLAGTREFEAHTNLDGSLVLWFEK